MRFLKNISTSFELTATHFVKELKTIFTDTGAILILIGAMVIYPVIYSIAYLNETMTDQPVAIVDQDRTDASRKFINMLDASSEVKLSHQALDMNEAEALLYNEEVGGIVFLPKGFQNNLMAGTQSNVFLYADAAYFLKYKNQMMAITYTNTYFSAGISVKKYMASGQHYQKAMASISPLDPQLHVLYNPASGYGSFIMPGIMLIIIQQTLLIGIGVLGGSFSESKKSPFTLTGNNQKQEIIPLLMGKAGAYLLISLFNIAFSLVCIHHWFNFPDKANFMHIMMLIFPFLIAVIFLGIGLSTLFRHRESAIIFMVFLSPIALFLSGLSWPISAIPEWLVSVSKVMPGTTVVPAYLRLRTMGVELKGVAHEMWILYLQAAIYATLTIIYFFIRLARQQRKDIESTKIQN